MKLWKIPLQPIEINIYHIIRKNDNQLNKKKKRMIPEQVSLSFQQLLIWKKNANLQSFNGFLPNDFINCFVSIFFVLLMLFAFYF